MRDTQSADKDYPRSARYAINQPTNPFHQLTKKPLQNRRTEAEIIQQFYANQMLQLFQKNEKTYPNPSKIIQSLKAKDKRLLELQRSLYQCQQKLRESQKTIKFQTKNESTLRGLSQQGQEATYKKIVQEEYLKIKLKFIPILQQYLGDSNQFIKLTSTENEKTLQLLFQCIDRILKNLKAQIVSAEERATERSFKKFQISEVRLQKQLLDQTQSNKKLSERINNYAEQFKMQNEERKKIEKEKNALHTQIYKNHQTIVEKSNLAENIREELQKMIKKYDELEKTFEEQRKKLNQSESSIKLLEQFNQELEFKNKELASANQKLQREIGQFRKKIEEELNKNLTRVRSEQNFTSLKMMNDLEEKKCESGNLKLGIRQGQVGKSRQEVERKQRPYVEKIINDWRKHLQKVVNEHEREAIFKDNLIDALEKENKQLKREIETRRRMESQSFK